MGFLWFFSKGQSHVAVASADTVFDVYIQYRKSIYLFFCQTLDKEIGKRVIIKRKYILHVTQTFMKTGENI